MIFNRPSRRSVKLPKSEIPKYVRRWSSKSLSDESLAHGQPFRHLRSRVTLTGVYVLAKHCPSLGLAAFNRVLFLMLVCTHVYIQVFVPPA
jgi:hypothetical protein